MTKKRLSLGIDKVQLKAAEKARVQTGEAAAVYAAKQLSKVEALQLSVKSEQGEGDQGPPMDADGEEAEVIDFGRLDDRSPGRRMVSAADRGHLVRWLDNQTAGR